MVLCHLYQLPKLLLLPLKVIMNVVTNHWMLIVLLGALKRANLLATDIDEVFLGNVLSVGIGQAPGMLFHSDWVCGF